MLQLIERLGEKYLVQKLASKYTFSGRTSLTVDEAEAVLEELEKIDELLKQLEEARDTAQIGIIDLEALAEFARWADPGGTKVLVLLVDNAGGHVALDLKVPPNVRLFHLPPCTPEL